MYTQRLLFYTCIEEEAVELWKEGGNAKGREGEDRSRTSTRELTLSRPRVEPVGIIHSLDPLATPGVVVLQLYYLYIVVVLRDVSPGPPVDRRGHVINFSS